MLKDDRNLQQGIAVCHGKLLFSFLHKTPLFWYSFKNKSLHVSHPPDLQLLMCYKKKRFSIKIPSKDNAVEQNVVETIFTLKMDQNHRKTLKICYLVKRRISNHVFGIIMLMPVPKYTSRHFLSTQVGILIVHQKTPDNN